MRCAERCCFGILALASRFRVTRAGFGRAAPVRNAGHEVLTTSYRTAQQYSQRRSDSRACPTTILECGVDGPSCEYSRATESSHTSFYIPVDIGKPHLPRILQSRLLLQGVPQPLFANRSVYGFLGRIVRRNSPLNLRWLAVYFDSKHVGAESLPIFRGQTPDPGQVITAMPA